MNDVPRHDELPLPDYDHLPLSSLEQRIRSLDADGLAALLAYERTHAARLPAVQVLERRLEEVKAGAPTSGGAPGGERPETAGTEGGSPVSPETQAPPTEHPTHGDPSNRGWPR
jgi:hypothetical protein